MQPDQPYTHHAKQQQERAEEEKAAQQEQQPSQQTKMKILPGGILRHEGEPRESRIREQPVNLNRTTEQGNKAHGTMGSSATSFGGLGSKDWT